VLAFIVLLMTGLQIFNGHPALYWGQSGSETETTSTFPRFDPRPRAARRRVTKLGPFRVRKHRRPGRLGA
jgi:hypothetical protein